MIATQQESALPLHRGQVWRRALTLGLPCVTLALLAQSDVLHMALLELLAACQEVITDNPATGALMFVGFAALSAMLAFVSVAVIVPVAVYTWGEPLSAALLWSGWLLGGVVSFCVGRFMGRPIVTWLTANSGLQQLERYLHRDSAFFLVLLFQLALPSEIPGYVLGLMSYHPGRYLLSLGLAELPYALLTIHLGASFVEHHSGVVLWAGLLLLTFSISTFMLLRKRLTASDTENHQ